MPQGQLWVWQLWEWQQWVEQLLQVVTPLQVPTEQACRVQLGLELLESSQQELRANLEYFLDPLHLAGELQCFHPM
uniref:GG17454 n=1 Tax=Drosophila erecta TaxID=7220 RepID=B3NZT6_DROER